MPFFGNLLQQAQQRPNPSSDFNLGGTAESRISSMNPDGNETFEDYWKRIGGDNITDVALKEKARQNYLQYKMDYQYGQTTDQGSQYYQTFRSNLMKTLGASAPTTNSLLGYARATGLGYGSAATIAGEQRKGVEGKIADYASRATSQQYLNMIGQGNTLLGMAQQGSQFQSEIAQREKEYKANQPGFFDYLGAGLSSGLGILTGNLFGGSSKKNYGARPNDSWNY